MEANIPSCSINCTALIMNQSIDQEQELNNPSVKERRKYP